MLSEARARLANTKGKKAKRKAREKAMDEAKRLASLQKTRELRAAGLEVRLKTKNARTMDYNAEVAFEARPAAGFFDVAAEDAAAAVAAKQFRPASLAELEGPKRADAESELARVSAARKARAWDDWKDEHPFGSGNSKLRPCA